MAYLLTEDNIKHCTLGFLKSYYKNNASRGFGNTEAKLDVVTADGIIADGYLKFSVSEEGNNPIWDDLLEDDKKEKKSAKKSAKQSIFLATFEATSQETAEEIQYKVQNTLLLMDALMVASIIAASSYGFNYLNDQFTLNELGFFKFWAGFLGVLLASLLVYLFTFRYFPRYRYIYAIAQFRKYHADEQWISYGEDVFSNPENKYLLELKKQCMRQGLGLITVDAHLQPKLLMTPARELPGGAEKKIKQFFNSSAEITRQRFSWLKLPTWLKKRMPNWMKLPTIARPVAIKSIRPDDYLRYTRSYWKQGILIAVSLFAIGEIYWKERQNPNIAYIDDTAYEKKILEQTKNNKREPDVTFLDLSTGDKKRIPNPHPKTAPATTNRIDPVIQTSPPPNRKPPVPTSNSKVPKKAIIISTDTNEFISYSCNRLAHLKGEVYLIQVDIAKTYEEALTLVKNYTEQGFKVNALSLGCFYQNNLEYVVYLDDIFPSKSDATTRANDFHKLKVAKGQHRDQTLIRVLKRMI